MLSKALALAWAEDGNRVNAVARGYVETAINAAGRTDRAHYQRIADRTAFQALGPTGGNRRRRHLPLHARFAIRNGHGGGG
jgi:NAD(P)-dependent dehydrogenase (short-subunit alcohol dehydrogenase family)